VRILISEALKARLRAEPADHARDDRAAAGRALQELRVPLDSDFAQFYLEFGGPFIGPRPVPELYDLVDRGGIMDAREYFQDRYALGAEYLALTSDEAEGAFVYNAENGAVYDFELGQGDRFRRGEAAPRWPTFAAFLEWYFELSDY
jgi:hypothetical protein